MASGMRCGVSWPHKGGALVKERPTLLFKGEFLAFKKDVSIFFKRWVVLSKGRVQALGKAWAFKRKESVSVEGCEQHTLKGDVERIGGALNSLKKMIF